MRPGDGRSVAEGSLCNGRSGRVAIQDTQFAAPALRGRRSGGGYGCSDNLGAARGNPKKENDVVTSGRGEQESWGRAKSPCHWSSTELRICVGSSRRSRRGCDG